RALYEDQRLAPDPGAIPERDGVGADVDQLVVERLRDTEPAGRVLAVDGDEIERPVADQRRQPRQHDVASAAADDVADEKNTHAPHGPRKSITSRSVST